MLSETTNPFLIRDDVKSLITNKFILKIFLKIKI
jgi:hypothetical protein